MSLSRRQLFGALAGFGLAPGVLNRALAAGTGGRPKTLVVIFLRGGVDGLSMVPPVGEELLATLRPNLRLLPPTEGGDDAALKLDSMFGLHPALAPLLPFWSGKQLAVVHAVGQSQSSRSHFDAQDFLESGTPGRKAHEGWLSRALEQLPGEAPPLRAIAVQPRLPYALTGAANAVSFATLKDFRLPSASGGFEALYADAVDTALRGAGARTFDTLAMLDAQRLAEQPPSNGARYPQGQLGGRLRDIARLIRADAGVQLCATELGGFDTHLAQGAGKGRIAQPLKQLGEALAAFATDLSDRLDDVCVLTMTEFGRTARENGNRGTDHGTASAMLLLGGRVNGGRVHGDWPGLAKLRDDRDLEVATDIRQVMAETLSAHLGVGDTNKVLPGFKAGRSLGLFG